MLQQNKKIISSNHHFTRHQVPHMNQQNPNQPFKRGPKHLSQQTPADIAAKKFGVLVLIVVGIVFGFFTLFYFLSGPRPLTKSEAKTVEVGTKLAILMAVNGKSYGSVTVGLYDSIVPKTVENFKQLCLNKNVGEGYLNSNVHRIMKNFVVQAGDFLKGDGTGMTSIYGGKFEDENFRVPHSVGALAMANAGVDTNGSQFFFNIGANDFLNGKHVVFGRVLENFDMVKKISNLAADKDGKPHQKITITGCDLV